MGSRNLIAEQAFALITRCVVPVNDIGCAIGEKHWRARVSDEDVDMIRALREGHRWSYRRLAARFKLSKSQVRNICKYRQRAHTVMGHRAVNIRKPVTQGAPK